VKKLWFILFYIIFQLLSCSDSHKTKFDVVIVDSQKDILPRYVDINELQDRLLEQNAVLIYYKLQGRTVFWAARNYSGMGSSSGETINRNGKRTID